MKRLTSLLAMAVIVAMPAVAQFGSTVAVSGDQVIAGGSTNDISPGSLYVYSQADDGTWTQQAQLTGSEAADGDRFGSSVSVYDRLMVVGAPGANTVYMYEKGQDGSWREVTSISEDVDGFGSMVALDGYDLLVGVSGGWRSEGSVHAYGLTDNGWESVGQLTPPREGEEALDGFPSSIAIAGGHAVAGYAGGNERAGQVMTWMRGENGWEFGEALTVPFAREASQTGAAVALIDGYLVAGMPGHDGGLGAAAAFRLSEDGEWIMNNRLSPFESERRAAFGSAIASDADAVYISAPGQEGGQIFAFHRTDNGLRSSTLIRGEGLDNRARFGATMAIGQAVAVIGATGQDNRTGVAVPFVRGTDGWMQGNSFYHDPRGYASVYGGMVECEEEEAGGFPCKDVNMLSFMNMKDLGGDRGTRTNDIWGWEDPETGREYALVGLINQTSFVDVTDAENPVYLGRLMLTNSANASVWRDMKVYKDHVYIVADGAGQHGMQVFDLRELRDFDGTPRDFEMTTYYDGIASSHNIVINEETGFAYAVGNRSGGETCGGGLHMIDISEPANPKFAGCFADGNSGRGGTGYSHDAQCVVYRGPDADYAGREICLGSNETALSIADVTDKDNPVSISIAAYPNVAYAHQGWLTEDHRYFYMNDEGDEPRGLVEGTRTLIWDLTDLDEPQLAGEHIATTTETDHNLYVKGNVMYQSNYGAGFRVLDISNPTAPVEIAYFDTSPKGGSGGSWSNYPYFKSGTIIVTGGSNGLFVLKKREIDT